MVASRAMKDAWRHAGGALVLGAFLLFNTATSKAPVPGPMPGPAPVYADAAPMEARPPAHSAATDLDVPGATRALCAARAGEPCRILSEFATATELKDLPTTGQDVWYGFSYAIGGTADKKRELFFLQIQRGYTPSPEPSLDPAVLDVSGSGRALIPDDASEEKDAVALYTAVKKGDPAPKGSKTAEYVRSNAPKEWRAMVKTTGASIGLLLGPGQPHVFVRKAGDRVLVVEYDGGALLGHADKGVSAKAWCAELWKLQ